MDIIKNNSVEDNYKKLKQIVDQLQEEESLEKSMELYIEGKKLIEESERQLKEIEKKISEFKSEQMSARDE